jgi:hypothetical protein
VQSILTLSVGDYRSAELALRLTVALIGMTALLLGSAASCVPARLRLPLILPATGLLGAAWFGAGVLKAWQGAFELAGTSYCVTGLLLASEDRVIAWSLGVPVILAAFALLTGRLTPRMLSLLVPLALLAPVTVIGTLILLLLCGGMLLRGYSSRQPFLAAALGCILIALLVNLAGGFRLFPLGVSPGDILVRGEILRSLGDILSLVIPGVLLLAAVLSENRGRQGVSAN